VLVTLALTNLVLSSASEHLLHIKVQYFIHVSKTRSVLNNYNGWDISRNLKLKTASNEPPCWIHTKSILIA
jgi:hypothetical protein